MRMMRCMCGLTRRHKVRNESIREKLGMALVEDKMQKVWLRWFGHMIKWCIDAPVLRYERLDIDSFSWDRNRSKKYLKEVIRHDMK